MRLIVHRGTQEIGGSCVELGTQNSRILLDFGMPLVNFTKDKPFDANFLKGKSVKELQELHILPVVAGLYKRESQGVDGIFISHSHLDHYGLLNYVNKDIPVFLSRGAKELVDVSNIFIPHKTGDINSKVIENKKVFKIGDFAITPYLVDHSAFDALAFLIEAEGKRVFYSGDFRAHGRKSALFEQITKYPPKDIDCLLMEGSMLGREGQAYKDEKAIEVRIGQVLRTNDKITFLFASSQNIDRLVSAYRACLKTDSIFVVDLYTAFILEKLKTISKGIPQFNWKNIRVMVHKHHTAALLGAGYKELLNKYCKRSISMYDISLRRNKILILARDNRIFRWMVDNFDGMMGSKVIYSMWEGYLTEEFKQYCSNLHLTIEHIHTSGHATAKDLKRFASSLNPAELIPIHTFCADKYNELFDRIKILKDDEPITI